VTSVQSSDLVFEVADGDFLFSPDFVFEDLEDMVVVEDDSRSVSEPEGRGSGWSSFGSLSPAAVMEIVGRVGGADCRGVVGSSTSDGGDFGESGESFRDVLCWRGDEAAEEGWYEDI
jgi:hypothetical protein